MKHQKMNWFTKGRWLLFLMIIQLSACHIKKEEPPRSPSPTITPTHSASPEPTQSPDESQMRQAVASTIIYDKIPERAINLKLCIQAIDKTVLQPGEEFSFNQIVGDRTKDKGYREAIGFDENGEKKPTVGGGICQIASTLYMAAMNGNFEITERHSHSHQVPYADSDHDATVSYGGYDFKFKNNRDKPIQISVFADDETVTAQLTPL
ncbi:MAG: VanW family protein [Clostridia bacterium]|nr:VanW family protein [Clostridia bacterium]